MGRTLRATCVATLVALLAPGLCLGNSPVLGHVVRYQHDPGDPRVTLNFHMASSSYPSWFVSDAIDELVNGWDKRPTALNVPQQNSDIPAYASTSSSGGTVYYQDLPDSPCTGSPAWVACNPDTPGSLSGFSFHVRVIPSASLTTYLWWDRDNTCSDIYPSDGYATNSCMSMHRALAHESEHNTLTRSHDGQSITDTIMNAVEPTSASDPTYWSTPVFLGCDLAGALLEYGVLDPSRRYPDCYSTSPGDGVKGLNTSLSVVSTGYSACLANPSVLVTGRLALANSASYEDMRNTPLAGRTVSVYRKAHTDPSYPGSPTYLIAAGGGSGNNWSKTLSSTTTGTWDYKAQWITSTAETALNSSNTIYWTITWVVTPCPLRPMSR